jgi:large subunit ribosomal protein L9
MERERREQQERLLKQLEGKDVTLERKANEQGNLYGAVSATDIAKALQADGYNVHPDDMLLPGRLDRIDTYTVKVRFAEDLETDVKVYVAPDVESKASIDAARKASKEAEAAAEKE